MTLLAILPSLCTNNLKGLGATLTLNNAFTRTCIHRGGTQDRATRIVRCEARCLYASSKNAELSPNFGDGRAGQAAAVMG